MESPTKTGTDSGPLEFREFAAGRSRHLVRTAYLLTGGQPVLTLDQLSALVTDQVWTTI